MLESDFWSLLIDVSSLLIDIPVQTCGRSLRVVATPVVTEPGLPCPVPWTISGGPAVAGGELDLLDRGFACQRQLSAQAEEQGLGPGKLAEF